MKPFYSQLVIGFILSIFASVSINLLPFEWLAFAVAMVGFIYILSQFFLLKQRKGRSLVIVVTLIGNLILSQIDNSLIYLIAFNLSCMWLTRCFYFHRRPVHCMADVALTLFAIAVAYWAVASGAFLSVWCFFLVQSFFVFISDWLPTESSTKGHSTKDHFTKREPFSRAYNAAQNALVQLNKQD